MFKKMMLLIWLIGLSSCTKSYDISQKKMKVPQHWHHQDPHFSSKNTKQICFAWWKQFDDPSLNTLVSKGLTANNDLQIAIANIEAAQGELKKVELNWLPGAGTLLGYSSFPYLGYPGVLAAVVPSYTINLISQFYEQKRAKYQLAAIKSVRDSVHLTVVAEIAANYFSYLAQKNKLFLLKQIASDESTLISIYESGFKEGLFDKLDLEKLKSKRALIDAQEKLLSHTLVTHQNAIRFLLNDNPGTLVTEGKYDRLDYRHCVIGSLPVNVIENRPDVRQATDAFRTSAVGVNIATSSFLPTIQLSMARGDIATQPNGKTLGQPIYFNQALLETPLVSLSTFGEIDKMKGLNKAAYYHYQNTIRHALREVDDDLSAHDYFSQRLEDTARATQHVEQIYVLKRNLYQKGIVSYAALLEDRIQLYQLKIKLNQRKLDQLLSTVRLYQDLAVGYGCMGKTLS